MDRPRLNKGSLFLLLFFLTGVIYATWYNKSEDSGMAVEKLAKVTNEFYYYKKEKDKTVHLMGTTMGSIPWNVKYVDADQTSYQSEIDTLLINFNQVLSTYIPTSDLSILNRFDSLPNPNPMLLEVLAMAKKVHDHTDGAFDPTVGPLVNIWGFGPGERGEKPSQKLIDSLLQYVGFDKVIFNDERITKPHGVQLDFSAIAKGYAVDKVGALLEANGIQNYMVEIGGEVRCKGKNGRDSYWVVAVRKPQEEISVEDAFFMNDMSMATSGNYENYRYIEGEKYSHTIDPKTGLSAQSSILSASICTKSCMEADAYATACMVLGADRSRKIINSLDGIEGSFIFNNGTEDEIWYTSGMDKMRVSNGE